MPLTHFLAQTGVVFAGLKKLSLAGTNLSTIQSLPRMESLIALDLSNNKLTNLEDFYITEVNQEQVYKFPRLMCLILRKNAIYITPEHYKKHFQRHFKSLKALDLGENQLTFIPNVDHIWSQSDSKIPIHLSIDRNKIPLQDVQKLFSWTFRTSDPIEDWKKIKPLLNTISYFSHEASRTQYNLCCRVYGHEDAQLGKVVIPDGSDLHDKYGIQRLVLDVVLNTISSPITEPEKEGMIKYINNHAPDSLNTKFLSILPQFDMQ
jgi:hypothetical protein